MEKKGMIVVQLFVLLSMVLVGCATAVDVPQPQVDVEIRDIRDTQEIVDEEIELLLDGTFSSDVTYAYHSGTETVYISISVQNGIITDVSIDESDTAHPTSQRLIRGVDAALQTLAVGKPIAQLDLPDNIAGSSLTVAAFKQYVSSLV